MSFSPCGEEGIRTPGTLVGHTRFPSEHHRPLGHLSKPINMALGSTKKLIKKALSKLLK